MNIVEACSIINDISSIPFEYVTQTQQLRQFCEDNHFHEVQQEFEFSYLSAQIDAMLQNSINYIEDSLLMSVTIIKLSNGTVIVGPYKTSDLTEANIKILAEQNHIDNLGVRSFRGYRSKYVLARQEDILHQCHVLLKHVGLDPGKFSYIKLQEMDKTVRKGWEYSKRNFENIVNERYRIENEFMEQVAEGDTVGAISSYRQLHNNVKFMVNIGSQLEGSRISAGITRTTVRIAAMHAGLPPVTIDEISGVSTQNIGRCTSREAMYRENERMIRDFTDAINRFREEKYSNTILSAIHYLENNYPNPISVEETADKLGLTVSAYIKRFKKETGKTPNQYLLELRMRKARRLLRTTYHTVQEIAESVGIPDGNYFVKCFRKINDTTPTSYRKQFFKATK